MTHILFYSCLSVALWSILTYAETKVGSTLEVRDTQISVSPVSIDPGQTWIGNDGSWSSFAFRIGTPAQVVRLLISTSTAETTALLPQACEGNEYPQDCEDSRGSELFTNESTTWEANNPADSATPYFALNIVSNLNLSGFGQYGFDTLSLGFLGSTGPTVNHTIVSGIATSTYWNGLFGVSPDSVNFSSYNDPQLSAMTLLRQQNKIPSLSYGYTAGARYQKSGSGRYGSFIFGGYDTSLFDSSSTISNNMSNSRAGNLIVVINKITTNGSVTNITEEETTLYSDSQGGIPMSINSAVSHLYFPGTICDMFAATFNLTYDNSSGLYLVSEDSHTTLAKINPTVTFTLSGDNGPNSTKGQYDLKVPYAAFDLTASYPLVANSSLYFPIRRVESSEQYTLGRAFLQETYLVVDYERSNFSLSEVNWLDSSTTIETILPLANSTAATSSQSSSAGIGTGAIIGIAVGVFIILLLAAVGTFVFVRARRRKAVRVASQTEAPTEDGVASMAELDHHRTNQSLLGKTPIAELSSPLTSPPTELCAGNYNSIVEMDGKNEIRPEMEGRSIQIERFELEGSEVPCAELMGESDV